MLPRSTPYERASAEMEEGNAAVEAASSIIFAFIYLLPTHFSLSIL